MFFELICYSLFLIYLSLNLKTILREIEKQLKGNSILRGDNSQYVPTKEVNTILVPAIPGKYIVLAIKPVPILFQNILEKISSYTSLYLPIPVGIGASTGTIKTVGIV